MTKAFLSKKTPDPVRAGTRNAYSWKFGDAVAIHNKTILCLTLAALLFCSGPARIDAQQPPAHYPPVASPSGSAGFPTGLAAAWSTTAPQAPPATQMPQLVEAAQIIARVGDEIIQAGDVTATVDAMMEDNRDRIPAEQWDQQRQLLIQQSLKRAIETKLVFVDALRTIPAEAFPNVEEQVNEQFNKEYVKHLMESLEAGSLAELETKLSANGSSIERQRQSFLERSLAAQWVRQNAKDDQPIGHDEMYRYYQEHIQDYEHPAKVKWQQLTVYVSRHPSKADAYQKIAKMGNDILIHNANISEVARSRSEGLTAQQGGQRDWTTRGALKSKLLDEAVFSLPVGKLSRILEDEDAFHIVLVTQRVPDGRTSFRDAQIEIRKQIKKDREKAARKEYFDRLRKEIRVWTIFDDPAASRQVFSSPAIKR